jgi:hypothetical protein
MPSRYAPGGIFYAFKFAPQSSGKIDSPKPGGCMRATIAIATLLLSSAAALATPNQHPEEGGGEQRRGPPPEALDACKGKAAGAAVEMKTPRGDVIKGTCRMVMIPDNEGRKRERY